MNHLGIGEGNVLVFTATFLETGRLEIVGMEVKDQPALVYFENLKTGAFYKNRLNLKQLVVTLTYNEGTSENMPYSRFSAKGIRASPSNGHALTMDERNGKPVLLGCNGYTAVTKDLKVTIGVSDITVRAANGATQIKRGRTL